MSDKKWLKVRFKPYRTPLGDVRVVMRVEEGQCYGKAFTVGVFKGTMEEVALANGLARDAVCWRGIPPLDTLEVPFFWRSVANKIKIQMLELVPEAKHYAYRG